MATSQQPDVSAASERRVVTVLFADLVGFTTLGERLDAEDVATIQDAYFGLVRETLGRYGGRLEKFIGDAAMAVFGVPRSLDGDAERAVRGGLALIAGLSAIGTRLGLDEELRVRVGATTGEVVHVVEGPDAGRISGDSVNTASRLQSAARPGTVLVDRNTAFAIADALELRALDPIALKGKRELVPVWEVVAERPERSRELAMGSLRAPIIGREPELMRLDGAVADVREDGGRRAITVVAPPGVGKTRLVDEFASRVSGDPTMAVWRARLRPEVIGPYDAVRSLLSQAVGEGEARLRLPDRLIASGVLSPRADVLADTLEWTLNGAGTTGETDRSALFAAWLEAFDALAAGRIQIWILEDIHWAGPDLLGFLGEALLGHGAPRLVCSTARPSFLDAPPDWASAGRATGHELLHLGTLEASNATELIDSLVGNCLPSSLAARIAERSDGNCLFIEELLRTWVGVGTLIPDGDGWRLATPEEDVALPASVHAIYASQLDDLPPAARTAARRGSVAGRRFPRAALEPLGVPEVDAALDSLLRRALVSGPLPDPETGPAFAYRHALLRDAGYASLARAERADLHVRLAHWLEEAARDRLDLVAGTIGDHYASALDVAPALAGQIAPGLSREECAPLAATWLERAGDVAQRSAASAAAASFFRRALELTAPSSDLDRARRAIELGRSLVTIGGVEEAATSFEQGLQAARRARDAKSDGQGGPWRGVFARGADALATLRYEQLQFVESWKLSERALAEMGTTAVKGGNRDAIDLDAIRLQVSASRGLSGETNDALPWVAAAERAVSAAEAAGDDEYAYAARRELAGARSEAGLASDADWKAIRELASARQDFATEVSASIMESAYRMSEAPREAVAILLGTREVAIAHGLTERLGWVDHALCESHLGGGDWARGIEAGLIGLDLAERHGYARIAVRSLASLLPMASLRSDLTVLERARHWFESFGDRLPDSPYGRVLHAAADLWIATGDSAAVPDVEHIRPAFPQILDQGGFEFTASVDAILDAWVTAGRHDWVREAIEAAVAAPPSADRSDVQIGSLLLHAVRIDATAVALPAAAGWPTIDGPALVREIAARYRAIRSPFWVARALTVLEDLRSMTEVERAERDAITVELGLVRPVF